MAALVSSSHSENTAAERHEAAMREAVLKKLFSRYASMVRSVSNSAVACEISPLAKSAMTWEMSLITCNTTACLAMSLQAHHHHLVGLSQLSFPSRR